MTHFDPSPTRDTLVPMRARVATRPSWSPRDFNVAPFLVIWEVTRACALACVHCRADAVAKRDPGELTTDDARRLIDEVRAFGDPPPLFVLTGGDPMRRQDLTQIVAYAAAAGLTVALTPSGTAAVTKPRLAELRDAGLSRIAVSLDAPTAEGHDAFRGVKGSYGWTMRIIEAAAALGLPLQINTTLSRLTLPHLDAMAAFVGDLPIVLWAVFFLIQTGRGTAVEQIDAAVCEAALHFLARLSTAAPFGIKTTEAPHYHRVLLQGGYRRRPAVASGQGAPPHVRAPRSVNDGNGFVFIDHLGGIAPSGFLPLVRGNVRSQSLRAVYRDDDLFRRLREPAALTGKCGHCMFRSICGGSRSRAYAATGSPLASDPLCAYQPGIGEGPATLS